MQRQLKSLQDKLRKQKRELKDLYSEVTEFNLTTFETNEQGELVKDLDSSNKKSGEMIHIATPLSDCRNLIVEISETHKAIGDLYLSNTDDLEDNNNIITSIESSLKAYQKALRTLESISKQPSIALLVNILRAQIKLLNTDYENLAYAVNLAEFIQNFQLEHRFQMDEQALSWLAFCDQLLKPLRRYMEPVVAFVASEVEEIKEDRMEISEEESTLESLAKLDSLSTTSSVSLPAPMPAAPEQNPQPLPMLDVSAFPISSQQTPFSFFSGPVYNPYIYQPTFVMPFVSPMMIPTLDPVMNLMMNPLMFPPANPTMAPAMSLTNPSVSPAAQAPAAAPVPAAVSSKRPLEDRELSEDLLASEPPSKKAKIDTEEKTAEKSANPAALFTPRAPKELTLRNKKTITFPGTIKKI